MRWHVLSFGLPNRLVRMVIQAAFVLVLLLAFGGTVCSADDGGGDALGPILTSPDAVLSVSPALQMVYLGSNAHIDILYTPDITGLYGADISMTFSITQFQVIDANTGLPGVQISDGALVTARDPYVVRFINTTDNSTGDIQYVFYFLNPAQAITTSGVLAGIDFQTLAVGLTCINFTYQLLSDRDGVPIATTTQAGCIAVREPTAVTLSSFVAQSLPGGVSVRWQTASEADVAGFNLYRGRDPDDMTEGRATKVNTDLIPAAATDPMLGASYSFNDAQLDPGRYLYWLEEVTGSGGSHIYGPVAVLVYTVRLYLPIIVAE